MAGASAAGTLATNEGTEDIRFANGTGGEPDEVYLRAFPNATACHTAPSTADAGSPKARDVTADGDPTAPTTGGGMSALRIPLPSPLPAGGTIDLHFAFTTTVPTAAEGSPLRVSEPTTGPLVLPHRSPILDGFSAETSWSS